MAETKTDVNDNDSDKAKANIKAWVNEVLDERETKATAEATAAEEQRIKDEAANRKPGIWQLIMGG